ncbi:Por secretion system C-terminal sorting domain-containing protein, partial [Flavobacterium glycines]
AHTATYTISGVNGENGVTVGTIDVTATTHTNAGTYTGDAWSFTGASNYNNTSGTVNDVISKAPTTVAFTFGNLTYDGNPKVAIATATGAGGLNQDLTVTYVGTGATVYGPSTEAPSLAGTYSASANFVETANYLASNKVQGFTILAASTTTTLTLSAPSVRYMDNVTLTAIIKPANTASALTGNVNFVIGTTNYGSAAVVPVPGAVDGSVQAMIVTQMKASELPGTYTVKASFNSSNSNYSNSEDSKALVVTPRSASYLGTGFYTGDEFVWTPSETSSTGTVALVATIKDANTPGGDVRGAKVTFYYVTSGGYTPIPGATNLPVGLVDITDGSVGTASAIVQLNIGSQNSASYTIAVGISGAYINKKTDPTSIACVTVSKPIPGGYVVAGGNLLNSASSGILKGATGVETAFSMDVKFNNKMTNPQGKSYVSFWSYYLPNGTLDSQLHHYEISSNAIAVFAVGQTSAKNDATFSSKSNLVEVLENGTTVGLESGITLQLIMTDNGKGTTDLFGITLQSKNGGVWFSSNWNVTKTQQQLLNGGNVYVSTSGLSQTAKVVASKSQSVTENTTTAKTVSTDEITSESGSTIFNVIAYPNPTVSVFTIEVAGNSTENIQVLVYDSAGRLLKVIDRKDGEIIQFGEDLPRGTYIAKITQGTESKTVNLIKK